MNDSYSWLKDLAKPFLELGTKLVLDNQEKQKAKGVANDAKALAQLEYDKALAEERRTQALLGSKDKMPEEKKSNTGLYIGIGVGAVVLIGGIIFAVTRK